MKTILLTFLSLFIFINLFPQLTADEIKNLADENIEKYRKGDMKLILTDSSGKELKNLEIHIKQKSHEFLFGALVFDLVWRDDMDEEEVKLYTERFEEVFNFAVFPFYWGAYEPVAGHPGWQRIENTLKWCEEAGITTKGHPLAWTHEIGLPDWVLNLSLEESRTLLDSRITENVTGFNGRISFWDVVNEPVNTVTWEMAFEDKTKEHRYRRDIPIEEIAPWVEHAYKTAHKANPEANYILNEFMTVADPQMRERFYNFTDELLKRKTPIDGLGIQAHEPRAEWFDPVEMWETLEKLGKFGLPLHITEFIPQGGGAEITGGYREGVWNPQTQAEYTEIMYRLWFGHPSVVSINWWAFTDRDPWLPGGGFLTEDYQPKPAFNVLKRLIRDEWMTKDLVLESDRNGEVEFRGFYGLYDVEVYDSDGNRITSFELELKKEGERVLSVEV